MKPLGVTFDFIIVWNHPVLSHLAILQNQIKASL
jgi:hypothetical protein